MAASAEITADPNSLPFKTYGRSLHLHSRGYASVGDLSVTAGQRHAGAAIETLLVGVEHLGNATRAIDRAGLLAEELPISSATLLHALPAPSRFMLFRADDANMRRRSALHRVRKLADRFQGRTTLKWEQRVVARKFIPAMRECAAKADLLLLDASVRPGLRDIAMGTSAERLLRRIQQPVLVVRRQARRGYRHVLVAVDLSTDPQNAIAYAQTLAPFAKVSLLHAYRAPYEGKMRYVGVSEAAIRWHRTEASTSAATRMVDIAVSCLPTNDVRLLLAHGYPVTRLLEKAQEVRADLIVVTKRERSLARALLEDSVSLQLVTRSPCDVLVVPQDAGFGNGAFGSAGICNIAQSHRLDAGQMIDENASTMDGRLDAAFRGTVSRRNGR